MTHIIEGHEALARLANNYAKKGMNRLYVLVGDVNIQCSWNALSEAIGETSATHMTFEEVPNRNGVLLIEIK